MVARATALSCGSRIWPVTPVSAKAQSAVKTDTIAPTFVRSNNLKFVTLSCRATNIKFVLRKRSCRPGYCLDTRKPIANFSGNVRLQLGEGFQQPLDIQKILSPFARAAFGIAGGPDLALKNILF